MRMHLNVETSQENLNSVQLTMYKKLSITVDSFFRSPLLNVILIELNC